MSYCFAYGCGEPISGREHVEAEVERQRDFWDQLVDIDRAHEVRVMAAACADDPELRALQATVACCGAALDELRAQGASKDGPAWRETIAELRAVRKASWPLLSAWKKLHKPAVEALNTQFYAEVKAARQEVAEVLYWPNYNRVLRAFNAQRSQRPRPGMPPKRVRKTDLSRDDGCLTVQIQRTKTGLGCAPSELLDGSLSMLNIGAISPTAYGQRRACKTIVEMRVDRDGHVLRLPVWFDRPIPGGRVKQAQITYRRMGDQYRWQLVLTVSGHELRDEDPPGRLRAALSLCHERSARGGLVVARLGEDVCEVPPRWMHQMDRPSELQGLLDRLEKDGASALDGSVRLAPIPLAKARRGDYRNIERERDHLREKLLLRRREHYRLWARSMVRKYGVIEIDDKDLARAAMEDRGTDENALRHRAATHTLRAEIVHQARKVGCAIVAPPKQSASAPALSILKQDESSAWQRRKRKKMERSRDALETGARAGVSA